VVAEVLLGDPSATTELAKLGLEHMTHEPHEFDFAAINSIPLGIAEDASRSACARAATDRTSCTR